MVEFRGWCDGVKGGMEETSVSSCPSEFGQESVIMTQISEFRPVNSDRRKECTEWRITDQDLGKYRSMVEGKEKVGTSKTGVVYRK